MQQFQRAVERSRVAHPIGNDREQLLDVVCMLLRAHHQLPGTHPVLVAADRVDLAVVGDIAERMGQVPGGERVRAVPLMHHRNRGFHVRIDQIEVVAFDLRGEQEPLVDDRPRRQAGNVEELLLSELRTAHDRFDPFADHVQLPLEGGLIERATLQRCPWPDEDLPHGRLDRERRMPQLRVVARHIAPAENRLAFFGHDLGKLLLAPDALARFGRQEDHPDGVLASRRQRQPVLGTHLPQEFVRHLEQHARAVARVVFTATGPTMLEILENFEAARQNVVRLHAIQVGDKADSAGIVFVLRVVQALSFRRRLAIVRHVRLAFLNRTSCDGWSLPASAESTQRSATHRKPPSA